MAILYAEGFDDGNLRGAGGGNNPLTISTSAARTGSRGGRVTTGSNGFIGFYQVTVPTTVTGWVYCAFRATSGLPAGTIPILQTLDNGTGHVDVRLRNDGKFEITRAGTSLGTGTFVATVNTWVHLGLKFTINDTTGAAELRINGSSTPDINLSNVDTRNGANAQVTQIRIGQLTGAVNTTGAHWDFDDLVFQDTTGSSPENGWLPDIECTYLFPTGTGDDADWTPNGSSPAATIWESIDEVPSDSGTTIVRTSTVNHLYTLGWQDVVNTSAEIYAVAGLIRAWKESAGTREIRQVAKLGSNLMSGDLHTLSTSEITYQTIWHNDPDLNQWTGSNFNSAKFGAKLLT